MLWTLPSLTISQRVRKDGSGAQWLVQNFNSESAALMDADTGNTLCEETTLAPYQCLILKNVEE